MTSPLMRARLHHLFCVSWRQALPASLLLLRVVRPGGAWARACG